MITFRFCLSRNMTLLCLSVYRRGCCSFKSLSVEKPLVTFHRIPRDLFTEPLPTYRRSLRDLFLNFLYPTVEAKETSCWTSSDLPSKLKRPLAESPLTYRRSPRNLFAEPLLTYRRSPRCLLLNLFWPTIEAKETSCWTSSDLSSKLKGPLAKILLVMRL